MRTNRRARVFGNLLTLVLFSAAFVSFVPTAFADVPPTAAKPWRALHLISYTSDSALERLSKDLPALSKLGINCLMLQVDYHFDFKKHPELTQDDQAITKEGAKKFVAAARENGIDVVPQFSCLGHQSWAKNTYTLLTKYPELDLTPGAFPKNEGLYCREWDPMNPKTNELAFACMDEIADAFEAKAFHVGMDEIFLLHSEKAPSTKDLDPADVFAKVVNDMHAHLVKDRGLVMLMWADRFIDGKKFKMGEWEASENGTQGAIDKVPKDIIMCPWHYEVRKEYESVPMFMEKGFRVLPSSWNKTPQTLALIKDSNKNKKDDLLVGHVFTTWGSVRGGKLAEFEPMVKGLEELKAEGR